MPLKNETIQQLHELQQKLDQAGSAHRLESEVRAQAKAEKEAEFRTRFREFMHANPIYVDLLRLIESDILVAELSGIWELMRRRIIDEHENKNRLLRRLPLRSPLLSEEVDDYIRVESFLPDLESFIQKQLAGLMMDENLDQRVEQRSHWYMLEFWNPIKEWERTKKLGAVTVDLPHKKKGVSSFIEITCIAHFGQVELDHVSFSISSAGIDLDDRINLTFNDVITYLADFLRRNDILFTPDGRKQRE